MGLFSFYDGSSFELFFDFPSYFPFSCYLSGQYVIILIVGAVITPTSDVFTLMMVSVPMYLLYEVSIWIVSRIGKKQREESVEEVLEKS